MHSSRPSKQFIVRGSIAIGVIVIVLLLQTGWFRALFHRKPVSVLSTATVGDVVERDTNQNGIPDWEEKLWGLDPAVLYTNGVPNKTIIEDKKKALGVTATGSKNETDYLAQELFTLTQALGQSGEVSDEMLAQIASRFGNSIDLEGINNHYSLKDIKTTQTSIASLQTYYNTMTIRTAKYKTNTADIDVIIHALETGDSSRIPELIETGKTYRSIARDLVNVPVPIGLAQYHLDIVNGFSGTADSFMYLQELDENATNALVGIAIYNKYNNGLTTALINMRDYLTRYGILAP